MQVETMVVGQIGTNCSLVWDEHSMRGAVIDPGAAGPRILEQIRAHGLQIEAILLTHGHFDHTFAVPALLGELPGVTVYIHADDVGEERHLQFRPPEGWRAYDEGDAVDIGALHFAVMHTPGHSRGSVTLRCGDTLFTGDTLFRNECGRTDLFGGDEATLMASLRRLGQLEGDFVVLPGHMDPSTLDAERRSNPYLRAALRE